MILIKNGHIKTMAGTELESGCILLGDDGKIAAVAEEIAAPAGAEIIDAQGRLVTPGCVEAHCHIGLKDYPSSDTQDFNEKADPITPQIRVIDSFNPQCTTIPDALQGGVTTICTGPGSSNVICGSFAVLKLKGKRVDDMILKYPAAMKCALGENPKNVYGKGSKKAPFTRMGSACIMREFLFKARKYYEDKKAGKDVSFDMKLEAMLPVFAKEIPLKVHAHRADDIFTAIRIVKEFDLDMTIDHCTDGARIAEELAQEGYPVIAGPFLGSRYKPELKHKGFDTPAALHKAGVFMAITTDASVVQPQYLPLHAGLAAAKGLPIEEAWKAITINPAKILGVADRVGSLEVGKDADLVIWTADPLTHIGGKADITIIDSKVVWRT